MKIITTVLLLTVALAVSISRPSASVLGGLCNLGLSGFVERVVFEPDDTAPERIQVWGTFVYVDGGEDRLMSGENAEHSVIGNGADRVRGMSPTARGYLYFKLPAVDRAFGFQPATPPADDVRREWTELGALAGTGHVVGFGRWPYYGDFATMRPDVPNGGPSHYIIEFVPGRGVHADLRVRPESEVPASPTAYQTNGSILKLNEGAGFASEVERLRESLRRPALTNVSS